MGVKLITARAKREGYFLWAASKKLSGRPRRFFEARVWVTFQLFEFGRGLRVARNDMQLIELDMDASRRGAGWEDAGRRGRVRVYPGPGWVFILGLSERLN